MHAYTEILQPSVISQCILLPTDDVKNPLLVIVRGNSLLQVFSDIHSSEGPRWLAEFPLQGVVTHMGSFEANKIFITFLQAKMVVLEWVAAELTFTTKSLHYYEKMNETSCFDASGSRSHKVSSDQHNKCLTFWFQREFAAFVQFQSTSDPLSAYENQSSDGTHSGIKSSIINIADLAKSLDISEIIEIVHLSSYREPTVAILAWNKPSWAGLVGSNERSTKSLFVGSLKAVHGAPPRFAPIISISDVTYEAQKIFAVSKVPNCVAFIQCSNSILALTAAGTLKKIELDSKLINQRFENSVSCQIPGSNFLLLLLESGITAFLDVAKLSLSINECLMTEGGDSCAISALGDAMVIATPHGSARVLRVAWKQSKEKTATHSLNTLRDLYESLFNAPSKPDQSLQCDVENTINSYGSLSSVTSIDNGLACATKNGVLVVERELPLEELSSVQLNVDVVPGKFYIVSSAAADKPILIKSYQDSKKAREEENSSNKKRRKSEDPPKNHTVFSELYQPDTGRSMKRVSALPRGVASDQFTFAVKEVGNLILTVQSKNLTAHQIGNWRFIKSKSIPTVRFAEIQGDKILVQHADTDNATVYSGERFEVLLSVSHAHQASVSRNLLAHSRQKILSINKFDGDHSSFDLNDLAQVCYPMGNEEANAFYHSETNENEQNETGDKISALFAMQFNSLDYIGVHIGRIFSIYEIVGPILIKRYTVPYAVNQSPIFVPELDMIVFPGAKSHIVVKGRQAGFNCHRLQLYGEKLLDVFAVSKKSSTYPQHELAWLDEKECIHFAQIDQTLDYMSYTMPTRHIKLETTNPFMIYAIAYHDEFAAIVVGANMISNYRSGGLHQHDEEASASTVVDKQEAIDGQAERVCNENDPPGLEEDSKDSEIMDASIFVGHIYVLPLTTYKFQKKPVAELEETLLDLKLVDYGEPGGGQMLAIGTAHTALESEETNGHIYLYKLSEEDHEVLGGGKSADQGDMDPPPIKLDKYSELLVRGAVSKLCEIMGSLAVAHGQQLHLYNYTKGLEPIGFFDAQIYTQDIKALRNILILGERLRGPRLVNFALQPHRLDLLASSDAIGVGQNTTAGNDSSTRPTTAAVEGISSALRGDLSVVHCGYDGRLQIFQYDPENPESVGGPKLVPLATFFTGRVCNSIIAAQLHPSNDIAAYGATSDGTVFSVKSLSEETFRTLFVLTQQMMDKEIPHAGLNPRMHRSMLSSLQNHSHQLIDVNFSQKFWNFSLSKQAEFARRLGYVGLARVRKALNKEGRDSLKL